MDALLGALVSLLGVAAFVAYIVSFTRRPPKTRTWLKVMGAAVLLVIVLNFVLTAILG